MVQLFNVKPVGHFTQTHNTVLTHENTRSFDRVFFCVARGTRGGNDPQFAHTHDTYIIT